MSIPSCRTDAGGESKLDKLRILFAGTPDICVPLLQELSAGFDVVGVLTNCDKRVGRSSRLVPPAAKVKAMELGIPVLQFDTIRTEARQEVRRLGANTLVSFAFGRIFGPRFLEMFPAGRFNVHPSALPLYRGPSPVQATIRDGLKVATISLQSLGPGMDEGDIWATENFLLDGTEDTSGLTETVAMKAARFVPAALKEIEEGRLEPIPQTGDATYCTMIGREDGRLDFTRTVKELHCQVRSCYPWPKAFAKVGGTDIAVTGVWGGFGYMDNPDSAEGKAPGTVVGFSKEKGIGVACSDGILWLTSLQLPSRKELDHIAFLNGNKWILDSSFE